MDIKNLILVEFSGSQKCFHITDLQEMVIRNIGNATLRKQTDYMPIYISETRDDADAFIEKQAWLKDILIFTDYKGNKIV